MHRLSRQLCAVLSVLRSCTLVKLCSGVSRNSVRTLASVALASVSWCTCCDTRDLALVGFSCFTQPFPSNASSPSRCEDFVPYILRGELRHMLNDTLFDCMNSLLMEPRLDKALVRSSSPTTLDQACHSTRTLCVCRLIAGGCSSYNSCAKPSFLRNNPSAETMMLTPGSRSGAILSHRNTKARKSCLIQLRPRTVRLQPLEASASLLLLHQSRR